LHDVFNLAVKLTESLSSFIDKYVEWSLTKAGKAVLTVSLLTLTLFFGLNLSKLEFDFELEKFFPKNHPESLLYKEHIEEFGYDNDFLYIILENERGVFEADFLSNAVAFEANLNSIEDVISVYSPLSLQHVIKSPTGLIVFPLMHSTPPRKLKQDSIRIFNNPLYKSAFSDDAKSLGIYLNHDHFNDPDRGGRLLRAIKKNASENKIDKVRLVGKLSASETFIRLIKTDFSKYLVGCLMLSYAILLIIFRNHKAAIFPFLISLLSILWTFGCMAFLKVKINLLSSLLPPVLFFVSMSDAVHLISVFSKVPDTNQLKRCRKVIQTIWVPTLLTSLTTAVGFLSLLRINTEPVQVLGLFAALGILIAFIITFTLGLLFIPSLNQLKRVKFSVPSRLSVFVICNNRQILIAVGLIVMVCLPGVFKLKTDAYLLKDLPKDNEVRKDFDFADSFLGGAKPYEIRVEAADTSYSIWDKKVMDEIVKIDNYLTNAYQVSRVQSPVSIVKYLHMVSNGGINENYKLPETKEAYREVMKLKNRVDPKRMDKIVANHSKAARLIGFFPELGSYETGKRNEKLKAYLDKHLNTDIIRYRITGTTYLIDKSHELLSKNLLSGILTAILVVGLILGLYFRSFRLSVISLIPNLIPLIVIAGIIGWFNISLNMTTAIIFTIIFGIAVDDTIHILSHYLRSKGSHKERLDQTFRYAGGALLITSATVSLGFLLFLFSGFGAAFYLGLFSSLSLVIALITDLYVLPVLLRRA